MAGRLHRIWAMCQQNGREGARGYESRPSLAGLAPPIGEAEAALLPVGAAEVLLIIGGAGKTSNESDSRLVQPCGSELRDHAVEESPRSGSEKDRLIDWREEAGDLVIRGWRKSGIAGTGRVIHA